MTKKFLVGDLNVGNSNIGYDSAMIVRNNGVYILMMGTIKGRKYVVKGAVAALNRGEDTFVTKGGDCLKIHVRW